MKLRLSAEKSGQIQNESTQIDMENFPSLPATKHAEHVPEPEWQQVGVRKSKTDKKKSSGRTYTVVARGFQWKVTKQNIMAFFKGINIVNGEDGINIVKNVAMEAHIVLASKADRKKALALHNKLFESRAISGRCLVFVHIFHILILTFEIICVFSSHRIGSKNTGR